MLTWWCSLALLTAAQDGAKLLPQGAAAKGDAMAQLKERLAKVPTTGTYSFDSTIESEGGGFGGPPGGGAGGAPGGAPGGGGRGGPRSDTTSGAVEIGNAAEIRRGETLAYRSGTKLVYKKGDAWEVHTPPDFTGGGGFGGAPGGPPGGGGGARGGGEGRERFVMMTIANMVLPHELLAGLDGKLKNVTASESGGKWTFSGALTDEAADDYSGAKARREAFERFGGGGGAAAGGGGASTPASGTVTLTFGADGSVEQLVIDTRSVGQRSEMKRKQSVTFKGWGKAKVEVPKDAAAKLTG